MAADEKTLQHDIDLARADVHRGEAHLALGRLNNIQTQVEQLSGSRLWAEHQLVFAGALAAMLDPDAHQAFAEALSRVSKLDDSEQELRMRLHEDFGKYLISKKAQKAAREQYVSAERAAEDLGRPEDVARHQLCIIRIDLQQEGGVRLTAFQNLKRAAKDGYTSVQQRQAWIHYLEESSEMGRRLLAARKGGEASVDYFRGVLSEIRRNRE